MAKDPAGRTPAPRKKPTKKPGTPAKKVAGKVAPARKRASPGAKKEPAQAPAKKRATIKKESAQDAPQLGLTPRQQRFVDEYLIDLNGTQAAIRAGYSASTAAEQAYDLLRKPQIVDSIAVARKAQQERTQITADKVVTELALIAFADARELAEVKTGCCRYCWGDGFRFQRTVGEYNHDREQWLNKGKDPADFEDQGGIGFNPLKLPHPECPNCGGDGDARVVLKDTRNLTARAAALYAGAKQTKEGIEIKMHSKLDAIEKLAKHLGVYQKDNEQKVDPLAALLQRIAGGNSNGFTPEQHDPEAPAASANTGTNTGANTPAPRQDVDDGDLD